jgi:alkane 1-monooxygenase
MASPSRIRALPFLFAYLVPLTVVVGLFGRGVWTFLAPAFVFVLTPVLDILVGVSDEDPPDDVTREGAWRFDAILYGFVVVQTAVLVLALSVVSSGTLALYEVIGVVVSVGIMSGAGGITIAHELMHRPTPFARALAEFLMTLVCYPHFVVEHILGHHKNVATPKDPASSRAGESLFAFLPRTLIGGVRSAWQLEGARVARSGARAFLLVDRRVRGPLALVLTLAVVGVTFGMRGLVFFVLASAVAVLLLESVNYIEHYGLSRKKNDDGSYVRVTPQHSWNAGFALTGWYLFHLPRHADHHATASRPFYALRNIDDAPTFPFGYATMILIAAVPPLWRALMDKRVAAWNARVDEEPAARISVSTAISRA